MTENRRQFTRISFQSPARLFLADGEHAVEVLDISLKGALVRPPEPMYAKIGGNGVLHVRLDGAGTDIRMGVTVVHHQAGHGPEEAQADPVLDAVAREIHRVPVGLGEAGGQRFHAGLHRVRGRRTHGIGQSALK